MVQRIHRHSLALYDRIDARPQRQPFLRHCWDDEFLAAYLGYDNYEDLNKLRCSALVAALFMELKRVFYSPKYERPRCIATLYLLQINDCPRFTDNVSAFRRNVHADIGVAEGQQIALLFLKVAEQMAEFKLGRWDPTLEGALEYRQAFIEYLVEECGVVGVFDTPFSMDAIPEPVIMEDSEDLEGPLRLLALWSSMKEVTKPSVWKKKFPWTIDEIPAVERMLSWTSI